MAKPILRASRRSRTRVALLVGTRKGAFIYRLDRGPDNPEDRWERIGTRMPKKIGDIGFPLAGKPAVYRTRDGGKSWQRQDRGLPRAQAWLTVKRQAMAADMGKPVGLYFGTTSGELWASRDEGRSWRRVAEHLPEIYSVVAAHRR